MNTQAAAPIPEKDLWTITEDPEAPGRFVGLALSENGTPLTVHSSHRELLAEQLITWQKSLQLRDEFLAAWKAGVAIAGPEFFRVQRGYQLIDSYADAVTKWQLIPAWDEVEFKTVLAALLVSYRGW